MKNRKSIFKLFGILVILALCMGSTVSASYSNDFSGSAPSSYRDMSDYVTKVTSTDTKIGVNWNYTDEGSHREWFRVVNSDGAVRGQMRIDSCDGVNHPFSDSSTVYSYYYKLQARRENPIDPNTHVSGTWRP